MASSALVKAREHLAKLHSRVASLKGKGEEAVGEAVAAVEVFGGALGGGFLDEKMGTLESDGVKVYKVQGVPVNIGLGLAAKAAAFMGVAGKHGKHLHDVGNGFLAAYGVKLGESIAKKTETVK